MGVRNLPAKRERRSGSILCHVHVFCDCARCYKQGEVDNVGRSVSMQYFLPGRDYVTFGSLLSQICLSSVVCNVGAPILRRLKLSVINISSPLCIPWPSSDLGAKFYGDRPRGTSPSGAFKYKSGSKIERWWTCQRLYLINGTTYGLGYN